MPDFDTTVRALRRWAANRDAPDRAAVELLIWHEHWLRRSSFITVAIVKHGSTTALSWRKAREFLEAGPRGSSSELAILDIAVTLGEDRFRLTGFGHSHRRAVAEAFTAAVGLDLGPQIPEVGHSHPDFIPGTPATCQRCALEANRD